MQPAGPGEAFTPASGDEPSNGVPIVEDILLEPPLGGPPAGEEDILLESARDDAPGEEDVLLESARDDAVAPPPTDLVAPAQADEGVLTEVLREPGRVIDAMENVAGGITCSDGAAPCMVDATGQPFRVLPRSLTAIYGGPSETAEIISNEVRPFQPAFVFARQDLDFSDAASPQGWYQVGYAEALPLGWMRARDVVEWRQALLLAYTHQGSGANARNPVLMFETREDVEAVVTAPDRREITDTLLTIIRQGDQPAGVIARESDRFLDIDEQLYFLPVIQWEREELFEEPSLYLQVFAAAPGDRATEGEGTLADEEVRARGGDPDDGLPEGPLNIDVKFVIDMTGSMQPYIETVTDALEDVVESLEESASDNARLSYGLVGYRDNPEFTPDLEWASNDFTPELVDGRRMLEILRNEGAPLAAQVSSDEWAEDVFAGVDTALEGDWTSEDSVRLVVVIGDASAHEPGTARDNKSTTGYTAEALRDLADLTNAYVMAVHLRDEAAASDWDGALRQFSALADNPGGGNSVYQTDAYDRASIERVFNQFIDDIANYVLPAAASEGAAGVQQFVEDEAFEPPMETIPDVSSTPTAEAGIEVARGVIRAALVDYLGDDSTPQRDFLSWVHDYDLADPTRPAFNVRVLVTREQLDTILRRTEAIQQASAVAIGARVDFFQQLRSLAARSSLGVDVVAGETLADQDFLPRWVEALPYRSAVLGMSPDNFANMSPNEQIQFERALLGKVNAMREILGNADLWIRLDENDPDLLEVTALQLSLLP